MEALKREDCSITFANAQGMLAIKQFNPEHTHVCFGAAWTLKGPSSRRSPSSLAVGSAILFFASSHAVMNGRTQA